MIVVVHNTSSKLCVKNHNQKKCVVLASYINIILALVSGVQGVHFIKSALPTHWV